MCNVHIRGLADVHRKLAVVRNVMNCQIDDTDELCGASHPHTDSVINKVIICIV